MDTVDLATSGLFFSWLAHDVEELVTMPGRPPPFVGSAPWLPRELREHGPTRAHVTLAISAVGVLMAAASVDGYRTRGRSAFYQSVLYGYGMHGVLHLASAAAACRYTCGSATALPIVLPFWAMASKALKADGVALKPHLWTIPAFPVFGLAVHSAAYLATRKRSHTPRAA
ncbi:HXXEE domain-containing protein [Actinomyces respiraculi]|uniref:HXXEE domain-containing protein n=1 Tax=Actinomyces respiraculi TaxID=2744574 RepID=A0A7T0LN91_9ACTO|nr:HXXEE domain-containing protein [Actinomyces respiraculi]